MKKHLGISGEGTPGRGLESAADRQAETTGGLNYAGTDVNRMAGSHVEFEPDREATQGDAASGDQEGGSSLSVGEDHLSGAEQWDYAQGSPHPDASWLESLFEDVEFPCDKEVLLAALGMEDVRHPDSGIDAETLVDSLPRDHWMNRAELLAALREELERRAHSGSGA